MDESCRNRKKLAAMPPITKATSANGKLFFTPLLPPFLRVPSRSSVLSSFFLADAARSAAALSAAASLLIPARWFFFFSPANGLGKTIFLALGG
jgi:hypothetical protein